jgi:acetyltransferase-like isoleucine patch superfamily enzyme
MLLQIRKLERYKDEHGNEIVYDGEPLEEKIDIRFRGSNNTLVVSSSAYIKDLSVNFTGDNGRIEVGPTTRKRTGLRFDFRCGHHGVITVGEDVGCAGRVFVSAVEGVTVSIGYDVMFARGIEIRADDAHPIYDVRTSKRLNPSQPIVVGDHVWIAKDAVIMGGVTIGNGSVVGFRSILTKSIPNNCIAAGAPARVVKRNIAWERPVVTTRRPGEPAPRKGEKNADYWNLTEELDDPVHPQVKPAAKSKTKAAPPSATRKLARRLPAPVKRFAKKLRPS